MNRSFCQKKDDLFLTLMAMLSPDVSEDSLIIPFQSNIRRPSYPSVLLIDYFSRFSG